MIIFLLSYLYDIVCIDGVWWYGIVWYGIDIIQHN